MDTEHIHTAAVFGNGPHASECSCLCPGQALGAVRGGEQGWSSSGVGLDGECRKSRVGARPVGWGRKRRGTMGRVREIDLKKKSGSLAVRNKGKQCLIAMSLCC